MNLTRRTNNAVRMLIYCALSAPRVSSLGAIAKGCQASEHHLAKVASTLVECGWIETVRGRNGGIRLAQPPEAINIGAVVRATENFELMDDCFDVERDPCSLSGGCAFPPMVKQAFEAFMASLSSHTLADLLDEPDGLRALLGISAAAPAAATAGTGGASQRAAAH